MNDASWGAPPRGGHWGPPDQGPAPAAPAGPARDEHAAQQTRPMPIVPDVPAGGDQDDHDRGAARLSGPPFRDEMPQEPMPSEQPEPAEPQGRSPHGHRQGRQQAKPQRQKKQAGRDLRAA
jgi:phosphatidate cytidylyltransferase